ncbi:transglycosylase SLT domain-containing protein [Marichromatium bheemlicum]|uniref:Transglycosylase SLT domain-containing protein n=1 Tax=Marichromatium bheemlicum TaxID=365339 RepID=A0ABX1IC73_9GAMM|nr:transglycosylase SLT domain-containing protein [Marichromatium bheemlicum]NKN33780.1 transglycosylase SLT domain-containing protein [Marichromatium bheemlicum]
MPLFAFVRRCALWGLLGLPLVAGAAGSAAPPVAQARADFLAAERALEQGDEEGFARLESRLRHYPLHPYLRFAQLTADLERTPDAAIERFLGIEPDSQLAWRLRRAYLQRLAAAGRWADYRQFYRPEADVERRCLYLRALIETGETERALAEVEPLWRSGRSRPSACDPVFDAWRAAGGLSPERVWMRIRLALDAGQDGLARHLGTDLPARERLWLARWLALRAAPERLLDERAVLPEQPLRAAILADVLTRLARRDAEAARAAFGRLQAQIRVDAEAADRVQAALGEALVAAGDLGSGFALWDGVRAVPATLDAQERRLRAALERGEWAWVARWVERMPESEVKADRWVYWQARAEAELGHPEAARALFAQAAEARSLWGFMAADRLDLPYRMNHRVTPAVPARIARIVTLAPVRRMRELDALGRDTEMRREWRALTRDLDRADLLAAAYVADVFGWHDQAIRTLARTDYWDDLALRFPLAHRAEVAREARAQGLAPEWVFAVIRQESVFARTLASHAGAVGLMQLLPSTARDMAEALGEPLDSRWALLDPGRNIRLGSAYLARMQARFEHVALATAAYNAGPTRVAQWRPARALATDRWIATIPFIETRGYVERVLTYRAIYAARLDTDRPRVRDWLAPRVAPAGE